jgi:hypothetical protein
MTTYYAIVMLRGKRLSFDMTLGLDATSAFLEIMEANLASEMRLCRKADGHVHCAVWTKRGIRSADFEKAVRRLYHQQ